MLAGRLIPTRPSKEPRGDTVPQSRYYPNIIGPPIAPSTPSSPHGQVDKPTHTSLASRGGIDLGVRAGHCSSCGKGRNVPGRLGPVGTLGGVGRTPRRARTSEGICEKRGVMHDAPTSGSVRSGAGVHCVVVRTTQVVLEVRLDERYARRKERKREREPRSLVDRHHTSPGVWFLTTTASKIGNVNLSHLDGRELVAFFDLIMGSTARKNASIACSGCRKRKVRCDGRRPSCGPCTSKNALCDFSSSLDGRAQ